MKRIIKIAKKFIQVCVIAALCIGITKSALAQSQTTPAVNNPTYVQQINPIPLVTNAGSIYTSNFSLGSAVVTTTISTNLLWNATSSPPALTTNLTTNSITNTSYVGGGAAKQNYVPLEFVTSGAGGSNIYTIARSVSGTYFDTTNNGNNINVTNALVKGQTNTQEYQLDMRGYNAWRLMFFQWNDSTNADVESNYSICNSSLKQN